MLKISFRRVELRKRYPLTISRGTSASSENLFVFVSDGIHTGVGELSPATNLEWTAERGEAQLFDFIYNPIPSQEPHTVWRKMRDAGIDPPAMAAMDVALWDLLAKQAGMPLYRLLGLPKTQVETSITAGLNPPEITRERVPEMLRRTGAKCLKIKLGSSEGVEFDKEHFLAAAEAAKPYGPKLRVDANGGWTPPTARMMMKWLAERGVDYVEQPLVEGAEDELFGLYRDRPLPIFVDESCRFSSDVVTVHGAVDGVNLKLMKCGGITEALRIVATARAHGMKTMIGCMSESSVAIAAGAAMGALFDHIDLDSHLNLDPDPATGAPIVDGRIVPLDVPGHGASLNG
ncbi:MAG TPA: dipeptide epimerase [Fimbriimonadaceae bacterium]|nr:dipeptide epimerase [Fimbriimonadaceae bacterium]